MLSQVSLFQAKCGVCEWRPCEGTGWNQAVGVNAGKGSCWGKGYRSLSSPSGVPNLLGSGSTVIGVPEGSTSSLSVGFVGSICRRRELMGEICL